MNETMAVRGLFSAFFAFPEYCFIEHNALDADAPDILEIDEFITVSYQNIESKVDAYLWANINIRNEIAFNFHVIILNLLYDLIHGMEEIKDTDVR